MIIYGVTTLGGVLLWPLWPVCIVQSLLPFAPPIRPLLSPPGAGRGHTTQLVYPFIPVTGGGLEGEQMVWPSCTVCFIHVICVYC